MRVSLTLRKLDRIAFKELKELFKHDKSSEILRRAIIALHEKEIDNINKNVNKDKIKDKKESSRYYGHKNMYATESEFKCDVPIAGQKCGNIVEYSTEVLHYLVCDKCIGSEEIFKIESFKKENNLN